jgi:hypothetical protein
MKRFTMLILSLLGMVGSAFCLDMSIGPSFTYAPMRTDFNVSYPGYSDGDYIDTYNMGSVGVFFDAEYLQANIAYSWMLSGSYDITDPEGYFYGYSVNNSGGITAHFTYIDFNLLGKVPIKIGSFSVFPLLGVEYDQNLTWTDKDGNNLKSGLSSDEKNNLNKFFFDVGLGADFTLSEDFFIRPEVILGFKMKSKFENDTIDNWNSYGFDADYQTTKWNFGLSLGYKF